MSFLATPDKDGHMPISVDQFSTMVAEPGFDKVTALLDPATPPSAAAKKGRQDINAAVAKALGSTMPRGFTLRLPTIGDDGGRPVLGLMDLVEPSGVFGFDWQRTDGRRDPNIAQYCNAKPGSSTGCWLDHVPGGLVSVSHARDAKTQKPLPDDGLTLTYFPDAKGAPGLLVFLMGPGSDSAMTADQFLAIAQTPGIGKIVDNVNAAANK
jgi:hypothetical protein